MKGATPRLIRLISLVALLAAVPGRAATNAASAPAATNAYRLLPSDKVSYWVDEDPKRAGDNSPLSVSSLGWIQFPVSRGYDLTIPIEARGKTVDEVKTELKQKLEDKYYKQATVHLTLLTQTQRKGIVYFRGSVITGTLELLPGDEITVSQAILQKGGGGDFANLKKVTVTRLDPATKKPIIYSINVKSLLDKPDPSKDLILQDKDIIEVHEKGFVW